MNDIPEQNLKIRVIGIRSCRHPTPARHSVRTPLSTWSSIAQSGCAVTSSWQAHFVTFLRILLVTVSSLLPNSLHFPRYAEVLQQWVWKIQTRNLIWRWWGYPRKLLPALLVPCGNCSPRHTAECRSVFSCGLLVGKTCHFVVELVQIQCDLRTEVSYRIWLFTTV